MLFYKYPNWATKMNASPREPPWTPYKRPATLCLPVLGGEKGGPCLTTVSQELPMFWLVQAEGVHDYALEATVQCALFIRPLLLSKVFLDSHNTALLSCH